MRDADAIYEAVQELFDDIGGVTLELLIDNPKAFVNEWCDEVHTTTKRIPNQHYLLEEKALLMPLPEKHYYTSNLQERKIKSDAVIGGWMWC